jgi:hypothetical protein
LQLIAGRSTPLPAAEVIEAIVDLDPSLGTDRQFAVITCHGSHCHVLA